MFRVEVSAPLENLWDNINLFLKISDSQLMKIAEAVRRGIEGNISRGLEFSGTPVRPLSPSTIKQKKSSRPLFRTGLLLKSIEKKQVSRDAWEIFVNAKRSQVAYYLHFGTTRMPSRAFFGISREADKEIDTILTGNQK